VVMEGGWEGTLIIWSLSSSVTHFLWPGAVSTRYLGEVDSRDGEDMWESDCCTSASCVVWRYKLSLRVGADSATGVEVKPRRIAGIID
jgi:hypothetical protein